MSRSRRKHPIYKYKISGGKRLAARAFRRFKGDISPTSRQFFRRIYDSYNVWDYRWLMDTHLKDKERFKQIVQELELNEQDLHLTEDEAYELLLELKYLQHAFNTLKK